MHRGKPIFPWKIECSAKIKNELYIDSHGVVLPCCWMATSIRKIYPEWYTKEKNNHVKENTVGVEGKSFNFYDDFVDIIEGDGGIAAYSLKYNTIEDIMTNDFFTYKLEELHNDKSCKFCANYCATRREELNGYAGNTYGRFSYQNLD